MSDCLLFRYYSNIDDFIDDSDHEFMDAPPIRQAVETSRHFSNAPAASAPRRPIQLRDEMEDCDEFTKVTTQECFEKLVRLRNDVFPLIISANARLQIARS
jgi:hypothetical protein